jgi:uncharacterized membrane protein YphA (DoxX/SURF4 family)
MGRKSKKKGNKQGSQPAKGTPAARKKAAGTSPSPLQQRIGRIATIALGVVFILAGTLKVADPWSFLGSLPAYGIPSALRLPITLGMPTIEVVLGVMLLVGWRTRIAALASAAVLAAFAGVIAYGYGMGTLQECGCFGPMLKRTPPEALAQDGAFIVLAVLGMMWAPATKLDMTRFRVGTLATVAVISVAMIGGTLYSDTASLDERIASAEPILGSDVPTLDSLNLRNRDVFLYLFHPDCPHCVRNGPAMARIAQDPDLPEIIGITHSVDPGEVRAYLNHAGADIKAYEFNIASFVQITGDGAVPQLVYLKHGRRERVWKGDLPSTVELRRVVDAASD